jgi:hypothetical protein
MNASPVTTCTAIGIGSKECQGITSWIIVVVIWKNTVRMIRVALAAKQMEAPVGEDSVDAAARFQHRFLLDHEFVFGSTPFTASVVLLRNPPSKRSPKT